MSLYSKPGNPGAFGSFNSLWNSLQQAGRTDITKSQVRKFLKSILAYTIHRPQRHKYKTQRYFIGNIRQLDQLDLADLGRFKDYNDGVTFLLVKVDCFSRFMCVQPLLRKTAKEMVKALEKIYPDESTYTARVMTDQGTEFLDVPVP